MVGQIRHPLLISIMLPALLCEKASPPDGGK
jgi:hypothetical protein